MVVCALILLFLYVAAGFHPRGVQRALALFLTTYCLIASFTEIGFTSASPYLLDVTVAASLLVPIVFNREQAEELSPIAGGPRGSGADQKQWSECILWIGWHHRENPTFRLPLQSAPGQRVFDRMELGGGTCGDGPRCNRPHRALNFATIYLPRIR